MKKGIIIALLALVAVSCKTQQAMVATAKAREAQSVADIAKGHYASQGDFRTAYIKGSVSYKDDNQSQSLSTEIRIQKDQKILVSLRLLGITVAKALITPSEVKYYEKANGTYFEGDYASLSKWLGTELDYAKVQRLLLGQAMDDLTAAGFIASLEEQMYKLEKQSDGTEKVFFFEAAKYLLKRQGVSQPSRSRVLQVSYDGHKEYSGLLLPSTIGIEAFNKDKKTTIDIDYTSATFNEDLSFPYSVPDGYDREELD